MNLDTKKKEKKGALVVSSINARAKREFVLFAFFKKQVVMNVATDSVLSASVGV